MWISELKCSNSLFWSVLIDDYLWYSKRLIGLCYTKACIRKQDAAIHRLLYTNTMFKKMRFDIY